MGTPPEPRLLRLLYASDPLCSFIGEAPRFTPATCPDGPEGVGREGWEERGATALEKRRAFVGALELREEVGSSIEMSAVGRMAAGAGVELDPVNLVTTSSALSNIHGVKVGSTQRFHT